MAKSNNKKNGNSNTINQSIDPLASTKGLMDLANPEVFNKHNDFIKYLITFDFVEQARQLRDNLPFLLKQNPNLADSRPEYYQQYEKMIILAKFLTLPLLTNQETISLVEDNLADALGEPDLRVMLADKIRGKILSIILYKERDTFKRGLREAMLRNNQLLTNRDITIGQDEVEPTVANWIKDYNSRVGAEVANQIDRVEYLTNSVNIKKLSSDEKVKVEALINIYEKLKLSSLTAEGLEEVVTYYYQGRHYVLTGGKLEEIKPDKVLLSILQRKTPKEIERELTKQEQKEKEVMLAVVEQEVLTAYQGDPRQVKAITQEEQKLAKKFKGSAAKIREEFFKAVQKKNINQTIAILRLLAQKNDLENFIKEDAKLNKFLATIWEKQYGKDFAAEFRKNPAQLKFVRQFLRYVLEQRLEMSSSDAARVGLQMGNIFVSLGQKGYNKMAYFDVNKKEFVWFE